MARLRYIGEEKDGKVVPLSGGSVEFPRMKWVDIVAEAVKNHVREEHAQIAYRSLITLPDWEAEAPKLAAKTKAAKTAETEEQA